MSNQEQSKQIKDMSEAEIAELLQRLRLMPESEAPPPPILLGSLEAIQAPFHTTDIFPCQERKS
jgi:hypothetical protein